MDAYTDNKIKTRRLRCWTGRALPYYSSSLLICSSIAAHKNIHFRSKSRQYGLSGTVSSIDVVAIFTSGQPLGNRAPLTRHHNHVTETMLFPIMDTSSGIIPYVFLTDRKQCVVREAEWDRFSARGFQAHTGPLRRSLETMTTSPDRGRGGGGGRDE